MELTRYDKAHPLKSLDSHTVARAVVLMLVQDTRAKVTALGLDREYGEITENLWDLSPLYRIVALLVEYAQGSPLPSGVTLDRLLAGLSPLYSSPRQPDVLPGDVEAAEPRDPLGFALAGAMARHALDSGIPLSCNDLAILIGRNKDHVSALAAAGEIPGAYRDEEVSKHRPWRFRVTKELRELIDDV